MVLYYGPAWIYFLNVIWAKQMTFMIQFVRFSFFILSDFNDDTLNHYWTNVSIDLPRRKHNYKKQKLH